MGGLGSSFGHFVDVDQTRKLLDSWFSYCLWVHLGIPRTSLQSPGVFGTSLGYPSLSFPPLFLVLVSREPCLKSGLLWEAFRFPRGVWLQHQYILSSPVMSGCVIFLRFKSGKEGHSIYHLFHLFSPLSKLLPPSIWMVFFPSSVVGSYLSFVVWSVVHLLLCSEMLKCF